MSLMIIAAVVLIIINLLLYISAWYYQKPKWLYDSIIEDYAVSLERNKIMKARYKANGFMRTALSVLAYIITGLILFFAICIPLIGLAINIDPLIGKFWTGIILIPTAAGSTILGCICLSKIQWPWVRKVEDDELLS